MKFGRIENYKSCKSTARSCLLFAGLELLFVNFLRLSAKKIVAIIYFSICIFSQTIFGQELPVYNEYHLNKSLINPAIIGSEPCTWIKGTDRHQWLGIDGAPRIQTLSVESSIYNRKALRETDKRVHGIGVYIFNDRNGAYRNFGLHLSYAYHVYLSKPRNIKMGMGAGVEIFQSLLDERNLHGEFDPIVNGSVSSVVQPDFDCGLFIYNEKFYTGLSAARLISSSGVASGSGSLRNYFLIAGFLTGDAKDNIRFLPSIVLKFTESLQKQIDLNVKTLFSESWWLGLSIRHNFDRLPGSTIAIIPMTGLTKNNFTFGYSLELTPGKILTHNYGTHEFTIAYRFCKDGFRCPVYR